MVIGKYVPPLTVASFATTSTSRPWTRPTPVTTPAPGAAPSYISYAASGDSSTNGEFGSNSFSSRSRTRSFPRSLCRVRCDSGPPSPAVSSRPLNSETSSSIRARLSLNSWLFVSTLLSILYIPVLSSRGHSVADRAASPWADAALSAPLGDRTSRRNARRPINAACGDTARSGTPCYLTGTNLYP